MEDNKQIQVQAAPGVAELVLREGEAQPIREEAKLKIGGDIYSPSKWYAVRFDQFTVKNSHIIFSREKGIISLHINDKSYFEDVIQGQLVINKELANWGINDTNKTYTIKDLQRFINMRKIHFADRDEATKMVLNLSKFKASVQSQIEQESSNRGNKIDSYSVKVDSNLDMSFTLLIPIHIGTKPSKFKVDICFDVRDKEVSIWLESPELKELEGDNKDKLIDEALKPFFDGGFVIIEQ